MQTLPDSTGGHPSPQSDGRPFYPSAAQRRRESRLRFVAKPRNMRMDDGARLLFADVADDGRAIRPDDSATETVPLKSRPAG